MRGWGRTLKDGIASWYLDKNIDQLAYQLVKYQQREGWGHRDLLRLAHPRAHGSVPGTGMPAERQFHFNNLLKWVVKGPTEGTDYPNIVCAFEEAKTAPKERVIDLILKDGLTREMVPTTLLNDKEVADALFQGMPLTAMIRNLANLTRYGVLGVDGRGSLT